MDNKIGINLKQYKDVIIRSSEIGNDVTLGDNCFITDSKIGSYCLLERRSMIFNSSIGDYSYAGYNSVIQYARIGKFCSISWNTSIGGVNHDISHLTTHPFPLLSKFGFTEKTKQFDSCDDSLIIGNDVWIASNVSILRGITIGDGAVIGAGAVVTHDVPPYEIWAGIPAKKIGQRFSDEMITELLQLKWWDMPIEFIKDNIEFFQKEIKPEDILVLKEKLGR